MPSLFRNKFLSIMPWHNCVRNRLCANVAAATCYFSVRKRSANVATATCCFSVRKRSANVATATCCFSVRKRSANVAAATCCWSLSLVLLLLLLSLRFRTDKTVLLLLRFRTDKTVLLSLRFRTDKLPQDVAFLGRVPLFQWMFGHPLKRSINSHSSHHV